MVMKASPFKDITQLKRPHFLQLIGREGAGCRRVIFEFIPPQKKVVWVSLQWRLYSPRLWKLAQEKGIVLFGLELKDKQRFRFLCRALLEAHSFDYWIFDGLQLTQAEGQFLLKLLKAKSREHFKLLIIDSFAHSFCDERIHVCLSHHSFRASWSKGGVQRKPLYYPCDWL